MALGVIDSLINQSCAVPSDEIGIAMAIGSNNEPAMSAGHLEIDDDQRHVAVLVELRDIDQDRLSRKGRQRKVADRSPALHVPGPFQQPGLIAVNEDLRDVLEGGDHRRGFGLE